MDDAEREQILEIMLEQSDNPEVRERLREILGVKKEALKKVA
jgi:hypothetical protein